MTLVTTLAVIAAAIAILAGLLIAQYWYSSSKRDEAEKMAVALSEFNPNDVEESARWMGKRLKSINAVQSTNEIARNDAIESEMKAIKVELDPLVGQAVSWGMQCAVHEEWVLLFGRFNNRGQPFPQKNWALMVLDHRPSVDKFGLSSWDDDPKMRFFNLAVPEKISRADAAKLTERVTVNGTVKEYEIAKYNDDDRNEQFLVYLYLTDVKLGPK